MARVFCLLGVLIGVAVSPVSAQIASEGQHPWRGSRRSGLRAAGRHHYRDQRHGRRCKNRRLR